MIDLDAIDVNALTVTERRWLNEYHAAVYETVAPHLTDGVPLGENSRGANS